LGRSLTATYTTGSLANEARLRPLRGITVREHRRPPVLLSQCRGCRV